jgi:hypothetical protein
MSGHVFVLGISKSGLVFASLGLYLQVWDVFASLACICSSGLVFAGLGCICKPGHVFQVWFVCRAQACL